MGIGVRNRPILAVRVLALAGLCLLAPFFLTPASAQMARIEVHPFETVTLSDQQFLTGAKDGNPVLIGGELRLPPGNGRFPAVLLIHGSAGIGGNVDRWAREFNSMGVAAFLVDSYTGRGLVQVSTDHSKLGYLTVIYDAYRALELMSKDPRIDSSRIAIMGFSWGGSVALYSSLKRFQRMYGPANAEFAGYIVFYGVCGTRYVDDEQVSDRPIRLFHGAADDIAPVGQCQQYVERLRQAGKNVQLTVYPGAHHAFDYSFLFPVRLIPNFDVRAHCRGEERAGGEIINLDTGKAFSPKDACATRGGTVGYDPRADEEALQSVRRLLADTFKLGTAAVPGK